MRNNLDEIIEERLENRYLWKSYLERVLTHKDLSNFAQKRYYNRKPFLFMMINLYYFPYNLLKYFIYSHQKHKFNMIIDEIDFLKKIKTKKYDKNLKIGGNND